MEVTVENVSMVVDKNILTIKVDLTREGYVSGSGKSIIVATTGGNASVGSNGASFKVGLNVYKPLASK